MTIMSGNRIAITRAGMLRSLVTALTAGALAGTTAQAQESKQESTQASKHDKQATRSHNLVVHIDQNDAAVMHQALNNASNIFDYYRDKNEDVEIEFVAYGPGLHMLRDDTSPVKDRIKSLVAVSFPAKVTFTACGNTMGVMEKQEGHPIPIVPQAGVVKAGVVRIMELQEQGYSYLKP
jgi:hypothetical protein